MTYYLGVDPGKTGAFAIIDEYLRVIELTKFQDIYSSIEDISVHPVCVAALEKVGAAPGMGVTSAFNFGANYGAWRGILLALGNVQTVIDVLPKGWQRHVFISRKRGEDPKKASIRTADHYFPESWHGKNHNLADALNLALFAKRYADGDI